MKRFTKTIFITLLVFLIGPQAQAQTLSSLSISPTAIQATKGQTFSISITLNPVGKNYTAKVGLDYPANLVRLNSFTFASGWMPLAQPGYDLIDNTNGKMLKTGGYPGGISAPQLFGTASFTTLQTGNGSIKANADSYSLNGENKNTLSAALPSASLTISAATPAPAPTPAPAEEPEEVVATTTEEPTEPTLSVEEVTTPGPQAQATLLNSLGNVLSIGTGNLWIGLVIGIIFLALIVQLVYKATHKTPPKKK